MLSLPANATSAGKLRSQKAAGTPLLIGASGTSEALEKLELAKASYTEAWLQQLAFEHPEVLPVLAIEPGFGEIAPVAIEVPCGHGYIDALFISLSGDIVLVEAKLWRNPQARREVVAQALDYVAALMAMGYEEFESACRKGQQMAASSLYGLVAEQPEALAEAEFVEAVTRNLARGRMLVIALGDGIRSETEALAQLLQSHAGAHFTFALVELASWRNPATGEIIVLPSTLARTAMITRGVVTVEEGKATIQPVLVAPDAKPTTISEELFFEELGKKNPELPGLVRSFVAMLEPLGVYPELKASLNLKADLPEAVRATNFGYITKAGKLWTDTLSWTAPGAIAERYNRTLASLIGGSIASMPSGSTYLSTNGKSAPLITALLPEHAEAWADAISTAIDQLRRGDGIDDVDEAAAARVRTSGAEMASASSAPCEPGQPGSEPARLLELHFKTAALTALGLPEIAYWLTPDAFSAALASDGDLPIADMLHGLQLRASEGIADWQSLEPALDRLAELLAPDDPRPVIEVAGDTWWVEIGPVDLAAPIVTLQRGDHLVAALSAREGGRLRLASYRPLDARSADMILALCLRPHPDGGVCMRENNWEYALDCSAGMGQVYAAQRGEAYVSYWQAGIGLSQDGTELPMWLAMRDLEPRQPARTAMELGVRFSLREQD